MSDTAPPFEVFRCPSCSRPGKEAFERCRHCGVNYKTGQVDGFAARTFSGGGTSLPFLGGAFLLGFSGLAVIATVAINNRSSSPTPTSVQTAAPTETALPAPPLPTATYTAAQQSMICRAGIAAEFGRSHKIMKAKASSNGLVRVSYRRPDDQKLWKSDCKVEGNRIIWRTVDAFPGSGPGRWRTSEYDDVLTFIIKGDAVTTSSSDGSSPTETYRF